MDFGIANKFSESIRELCNSGDRSNTSLIDKKSVTKANWFSILLRRIFLLIDLFRFNKLINKLEHVRFDYLISDRYFYDSIINIAYLLRSEAPKLPENIIKPDLAIFLQIEPEVIMQRERTPDQGMDYLKKKAELYSNTSNKWNLITIDGNRSKEEIFEGIARLL